MKLTVLSEDGSRIISAEPGMSVLDALLSAGNMEVHAPCGGKGTCRKCTVHLVEADQERAVLACQTLVTDHMIVRISLEQALAVETNAGKQTAFAPDPELSGYGVACDIGTTTVVCHLHDLATGKCVATVGEGNAQRPYGADVIARIKASMEGKREALTKLIREQLGAMIFALCEKAGAAISDVSRMSIAANTTMCHLLCGLAPDGLGAAPFTPVSYFGDTYSARELDLPFEGEVYIAPAVSGYVGGDITADLLAADLDHMDQPVLLIDVGTNGEMAIGCGSHFVCCSTAAGPAFEGAQISHGMTAAPGAISAVTLKGNMLEINVIGGGEAKGICGSGLIDAVAVMLELGALDETGRILDEEEDDVPASAEAYLCLTEDDEPAFKLSDHVWVTQSDVRKLQLGKGAIAAGERVLLDAFGVELDQIGGLLLAGGFGSYINPESAARIGLISEELLPVTKAAGNTAALGAQKALLSEKARERLATLRENMVYLELSGMQEFNNAYMEAMMFPESE